MKRLQHDKQVNSICKPQLTSLIDVMTILLVFLMKSFSVEGNLITPSRDLSLPLSTAKEVPEPVTTLEITAGAILSDGLTIASTRNAGNDDSLAIPLLSEWLKLRNSGNRKEIMLQSDRHIPFAVIKRVMYTCSKAGFDDFTILVQQEG